MRPLCELGAAEAIVLLRRGELRAEALVRACLERIAAEDHALGAFEHLDPEAALAAARRADTASPRLPLAGLPVAVKDIIDTADLPTERGSAIFRGRRPPADATCVARLRAAGAVILGKTVTTELAFYRPGKTRNPRDPSRTPGGSSSGSAAAVAAGMVPAAMGSQTAGSVIRPASFCGVIGFKPTLGLLPLDGVSPLAPSLDTLGLFVRDVEGIAPLLAAMGGPAPDPHPRRTPPRLALCRTEQWPLAEPSTRRAVEGAAAVLERAGARVEEHELGPAFAGLADAQRAIMAAEAARALGELRASHGGELSEVLLALLREGDAIAPDREQRAHEAAAAGRAALLALLARFDAILTASAPGEAPPGLASTGDPAFNRSWTLLGAPCVTLPVARGPARLPVGVQLVGAPGADGALIATAGWAARALGLTG